MLNEINDSNKDIAKLLTQTKKRLEDAKKKYSSNSDDAVLLENSIDEEEENINYNSKGLVAHKSSVKLKDTTILPNRYNTKLLSNEVYYHGQKITQMDLMELAYQDNLIILEEDKPIWDNYSKAWKVMIEEKAEPLYDWSSNLYSEDKIYKFDTIDDEIVGVVYTKNYLGVSILDMAYEIANGISPDDIEDVSWLSWNDRELYEASIYIGKAKNLYINSTNEYNADEINFDDYLDNISPLFFVLYGDLSEKEKKLEALCNFFNDKNYAENALTNYDKSKYSAMFEN